jgi:CBS domain-containing protein
MVEEIILEEEAIALERTLEGTWPGEAILGRPIHTLPELQPPIVLAPDATVRAALEVMNRATVGCVLVVEDGKLAGIFTERDLLTKVAGTLDVDTTRLADVMTRDPECLTLDDSIAYALNKMSVGGFRHVPLVDADGRPTGLVGMRSVVDFLVELFPREVLTLPSSPAKQISPTREGA